MPLRPGSGYADAIKAEKPSTTPDPSRLETALEGFKPEERQRVRDSLAGVSGTLKDAFQTAEKSLPELERIVRSQPVGHGPPQSYPTVD